MSENPKLDFVVAYLRDNPDASFWKVTSAYDGEGGPGLLGSLSLETFQRALALLAAEQKKDP